MNLPLQRLIPLGTLLLCPAIGLAEYDVQKMRQIYASPKELGLRIRDENGKPVTDASVHLLAFRLNSRGRYVSINEKPDDHGELVARAPAFYGFDKLTIRGGKQTALPYYTLSTDNHGFIQYAAVRQDLDVTLPHIVKPIPLRALDQGMLHRRFNGPNDKLPPALGLPDFAESIIGFDAENCQAVEPFGRGKTTDFYVVIQSVFRGYKDSLTEASARNRADRGVGPIEESKVIHGSWTHTLTFRFINPGDGIILSPQFWPYCRLQMPHQAPAEGYVAELSLSMEEDQVARQLDLKTCRRTWEHNGFFLRVRSQVDQDGQVVAAHYAKIVSPHLTGMFKQVLRWSFFYNPTANDRNLEYDFKRNLLWEANNPASTPIPPLDHHHITIN